MSYQRKYLKYTLVRRDGQIDRREHYEILKGDNEFGRHYGSISSACDAILQHYFKQKFKTISNGSLNTTIILDASLAESDLKFIKTKKEEIELKQGVTISNIIPYRNLESRL